MDHEQLYEALDASRERLLVAIDELPDEALLQPGVVGEWSVRDLLVHLTLWEAELVTGLMKAKQGKRPEQLLAAEADRQAFNTSRHQENLGRDLDIIFKDLQGVRYQLEQWLEEFSYQELNSQQRYKWLNGKPLWQLIAETSFAHENAHLPALEQFAARWVAPAVAISDIEIS